VHCKPAAPIPKYALYSPPPVSMNLSVLKRSIRDSSRLQVPKSFWKTHRLSCDERFYFRLSRTRPLAHSAKGRLSADPSPRSPFVSSLSRHPLPLQNLEKYPCTVPARSCNALFDRLGQSFHQREPTPGAVLKFFPRQAILFARSADYALAYVFHVVTHRSSEGDSFGASTLTWQDLSGVQFIAPIRR